MHVNIKGIEVDFEEYGAGPAVVLLHDSPLGENQEEVDSLMAAGYRVITMDLHSFRGITRSKEIAGNAIVKLLDYRGIGRAVFIGLSAGGDILSSLLVRHYRRLAGAAVIAPRGLDAKGEEGSAGAHLVDLEQPEKANPGLVEFLRGVRRERSCAPPWRQVA